MQWQNADGNYTGIEFRAFTGPFSGTVNAACTIVETLAK